MRILNIDAGIRAKDGEEGNNFFPLARGRNVEKIKRREERIVKSAAFERESRI